LERRVSDRLRQLALLLAAVVAATSCHSSGGSEASPDAGFPRVAARGDAQASRTAAQASWEHSRHVFNVPVGDSPVGGNPDALVTVVQFGELTCAACNGVEAMLKGLRAKYGEELRLVWKNNPPPYRAAAEPAAEAALEVRAERGDQAFWEVHDRLLEHAGELANAQGANMLDTIVSLAGAAGADPRKVRSAVVQRAHKEDIDEDVDLAEDLEARNIPQFFVNGRRLDGTSRESFERMIDEELGNAKELLARGTPRAALYEAMVKDGHPGPWVPESIAVPASLPANDPALGSRSASVTVHVWNDYQCVLCVGVDRTIAQLRKEYGERVRFVWHDLPLARHKDSRMAARASREAYAQGGERAFWAMHDRIFNDPQPLTRSDLDSFARALKLDMGKWSAALDGGPQDGSIDADVGAAAEAHISEPPAYLVVPRGLANGTLVGYADAGEKLPRAVERALDHAEK
jgi:protein-disulfide isomerase